MAIRIGIVAGEASGDLLGSHLIRALKKRRSDLEFIGIAGPKMMAEGAQSLVPIEHLSVRGYVEVLRDLPKLLGIRRDLKRYFKEQPPAVFIGIDAPDFNFDLELDLKKQGIPTVHYVSPSIWAWRKGKLGKIKRAVTHMLALFPFEPAIYQKAGVKVSYVGHPLADEFALKPNTSAARESMKLKHARMIITLLPGSRRSEVSQHAKLMIETARIISKEEEGVQFLVPLVTRETRTIFESALFEAQTKHPDEEFPIQILFGHAHMAMEASDIVIAASGTVTLEAALLKRPIVITYLMPRLSWHILKRMLYLPYVGLPNVLAGRFVVPELLQKAATPEALAEATLKLVSDKAQIKEIKEEFTRMHKELRQDSANKAAEVVLQYL